MKSQNKTSFVLRRLNKTSENETITLAQNEQKTIVIVVTDSCEYSLTIDISGENAAALILGFIAGNNTNEIKIHTQQNHLAPRTMSDLHFKSILRDNAFFKYEGFITIAKDAQRSNAYQRNDNLLLSPKAKAESKPALEILANDVRCTHGATLGRIDKEQLFYLKSRGISQRAAERLIISGFFQVLVNRISNKKIQKQVLKELVHYV